MARSGSKAQGTLRRRLAAVGLLCLGLTAVQAGPAHAQEA